MTRLVQLLSDTLIIVRTDRRVWSAFGFIVVAVLVWSATSVWRKNVAENEVHKGKPPEEPGRRQSVIEFHQEWLAEKKRRELFHENLHHAVNAIKNDREEIEWNANKLVDKLNGMTMKVDQIIAGIGQARLDKARVNERIAKQKTRNPKKVINIDRSELNMAR